MKIILVSYKNKTREEVLSREFTPDSSLGQQIATLGGWPEVVAYGSSLFCIEDWDDSLSAQYNEATSILIPDDEDGKDTQPVPA